MTCDIFDRRRQSVYSTLLLKMRGQLKPQSCLKLVNIVDPIPNVYIIVVCPDLQNASNYTVTTLNWIPGTDNLGTYRTLAGFPVLEWVLYQKHTFIDKRDRIHNTSSKTSFDADTTTTKKFHFFILSEQFPTVFVAANASCSPWAVERGKKAQGEFEEVDTVSQLRKVSFWQGLRAGQIGAELQYQVHTHRESPSSPPSSAKSLDPFSAVKLSVSKGKNRNPKKIPWTWTREVLEIILDLPFGFPINNIISLSPPLDIRNAKAATNFLSVWVLRKFSSFESRVFIKNW